MPFANESEVKIFTQQTFLEGVTSGQTEDETHRNSTDFFLEDNAPNLQILMISDELMWILTFYLNTLLCGAMAIFGTFNNVVNVIVFYRMGLNDSMSVYLFALSVTDFLLSCVIVFTRALSVWYLFFDDVEFNPRAIWYVGFAFIADSLFLTSGWITTCLSLERCVCVLFPFKVKRIFTRNRSVVCVIVVHLVTTATYLPIYLTQWLAWVTVEVEPGNGTASTFERRLVAMFSSNRIEIEYYVEIFNVTVIPVPSLLIILGSVFFMVYGLVKSSSKRRSMTATGDKSDKGGDAGSTQDSKLNYKTRRLVKVVLFLALIFTICSIPRTYASYLNLINRHLNKSGADKNWSNFIWQLARFCSTLNASVNFFVYLKINSSYRVKFQELFSGSKK